MKKCKIKEPTVMRFATPTGEVCHFSFGYNSKFEYKDLKNGKVSLFKNNFDIEISKKDFEKLFKTLD